MIRVLNAIYGGERFVGDGLETIIDLGSHLSGFCLDRTGKLRASNAEISGDIFANNGYFKGDIITDSLLATKQQPTPTEYNIPFGATYSSISPIYPNVTIDGVYNNKSIIKFTTDTVFTETPVSGTPPIVQYDHYLYAVYADTTTVLLAHYRSRSVYVWDTYDSFSGIYLGHYNITTTNPTVLQYNLRFKYIGNSSTLKIMNIPQFVPEENGQVYQLPGSDVLHLKR